jgi:3-beta hydroxysteroid dehydrogenase/isomerase family.
MNTTYIDNTAQTHLDTFKTLAPGATYADKTYFISNDEPREMRHIVNDILMATGVPPMDKSIPYGMTYAASTVLELA